MEPHWLFDQHIDNLLIRIKHTQMRTTLQWTYQISFVYWDLVAEKYFFYFVRLIGSFIRWYGRPVDLPRVIEMLCLFTSGAQRNEWKTRWCSISTHNSTYFFRKQHLFSYTCMAFIDRYLIYISVIIVHCHSTWLRNVGHRVYYVALR